MPRERPQTERQALRAQLAQGSWTVAALSEALGLSQREVVGHLEALGRGRTRLVIEPARCLACAFVFRDRTRPRRPGRCPQCRSTRISAPQFSLG